MQHCLIVKESSNSQQTPKSPQHPCCLVQVVTRTQGPFGCIFHRDELLLGIGHNENVDQFRSILLHRVRWTNTPLLPSRNDHHQEHLTSCHLHPPPPRPATLGAGIWRGHETMPGTIHSGLPHCVAELPISFFLKINSEETPEAAHSCVPSGHIQYQQESAQVIQSRLFPLSSIAHPW